MRRTKVRNPLIRRIPKELLGDWKKYLVVFLLLVLTIGFVSGMYVANESMMKSADESVTKYALEDGHFELQKKADAKLIKAIETGEKADVRQYYLEEAKSKLDDQFAQKFDEAAKEMMGDAYQQAYDEAWDKIKEEVEDTYAEAEEKYELSDSDFEARSVKVYENFYRNENEDYDNDGKRDGTIRIFARNEEINRACLMEGSFPKQEDEIAIDRMHADNVGITVGDTVTVSGTSYKVVGLIAYVNYATLHEKATDMMFDALQFDVAMVTQEGFDRLSNSIHYTYAWKYEKSPTDDVEKKTMSDDFMRALLTQTVVFDNSIADYVPEYSNPAIHFATDDMGSDEAMGGVLLDIQIVIMAFIFAVTISNTIVKESKTIGTLRASGYTKGELVRHYISMPVIVTLVAACVGNVLGYTVFKNVVVSMYYNSYSLPTYETVWNPDAFYKTTLIPVILMLVINLIVILRMMQHTPLKFLRADLKKAKRKKAMRLPRWRFLNRFRLRILFQNMANYLILFAGIFFIAVMLAMAVGMPDSLSYYKENASDMMFAKYQYVLKSCEDEDGDPITTDNKEAEAFSMTTLLKKSDALEEEVSVYGISDNSTYADIPELVSLPEGEVYISGSFAEKYDLAVGDKITLDEKYENKKYTVTVAGFYDKCSGIAVFLSRERYDEMFDVEENEFTGFFSDSEITDLDEDQVATVITEREITKMVNQLDHSMGSYMDYFQVSCILLSALLIYLLTKLIIEKNENAISMTKILGYDNKEIAGLYLLATTIAVLVEDAVSVYLGGVVLKLVWKEMMATYSGWIEFLIMPTGYVKMFVFILIGYLIVMVFDFNRIKKIPMDQALKNAE